MASKNGHGGFLGARKATWRAALAGVLAGAGLFCVPGVASAQGTDELADWPSREKRGDVRDHGVGVGLGARTDVPLFVGAEGFVEHGPTRLRLTGALGVLPGAYERLINRALSNAGAYDDRLARALNDTLATGFAWNAHLGFRPLARHGLLVEVGYGVATLVANGDARELVSREVGASVPTAQGIDTTLGLRSTLHLVDARIGWEWLVADHVTVHASLGVSRAVAASTTLEQRYLDRAPALAQNAIAQGTGTLDDALTRYGWTPTAGVAAGYRF